MSQEEDFSLGSDEELDSLGEPDDLLLFELMGRIQSLLRENYHLKLSLALSCSSQEEPELRRKKRRCALSEK